jgi:alpha-tubulin suppressor-like RCC1 family protein
MGLTSNGIQKQPVEMLPGNVVVKIASGADHLVMLSENGQLYTCGCGEQGQLGRVTERGASRGSRQGMGEYAPVLQCMLQCDPGSALSSVLCCSSAAVTHAGNLQAKTRT